MGQSLLADIGEHNYTTAQEGLNNFDETDRRANPTH
jgi:hypothetical protein